MKNELLPFRTSFSLTALMDQLRRTTTLSLACALALLAAAVPAAAIAASSPSGGQYVLEQPSAGENGSGTAEGQSGDAGSDRGSTDRALTGIAADSADDGALPILLIVLVGTAAVGAGIAILRRRRTT
jgi:hypothetical protein